MQRHSLDEPLTPDSLLDLSAHLARTGIDTAPDLTRKPRAVVVASDPLVADSFEERLPGIVIAKTSDLARITDVAREHRADVVLWDLGPATKKPLTDIAGVTANVPVVVLATGDGIATRLVSAGVKGVLRRDAPASAIEAAVSSVRHGLQVVDPSLAPAPRTPVAADLPRTESLTPREIEVLELVAKGLSNRKIAVELGISAHTVKFHVNAILAKLDVHTRTEAVVRGVQLGVVMV